MGSTQHITHLLTSLDYVAKHSINGKCKVAGLSGPYPKELDTDISKAYVSESAEVLHFLCDKKLRNSKIQKMLEGCRLSSSAVFGICQQTGILRTGALMTR